MGLNFVVSSSSLGRCNRPHVPLFQKLPNPDPANYKIKKDAKIGRYLVVWINYPDCTNYEGDKILVFENTSLEELMAQKLIDPHFSESAKYKHPIARFEPTTRGWVLACQMGIFG